METRSDPHLHLHMRPLLLLLLESHRNPGGNGVSRRSLKLDHRDDVIVAAMLNLLVLLSLFDHCSVPDIPPARVYCMKRSSPPFISIIISLLLLLLLINDLNSIANVLRSSSQTISIIFSSRISSFVCSLPSQPPSTAMISPFT